MLEALKFVQGAIARRDFVPEMKHFVISDGSVRAFNGTLALSSPIDLTVDCAPLAIPMVKAISNCDDVVGLGLTDKGRLRVQSGGFKAFIECVDLECLPHQKPEGEEIEFDGEQMMLAIKKLTAFIGNDASRPWTNGILLRGQSAFATNNVCLVEYWIGSQLPFTVNIPMGAIKEMARIGEPPTHAQLTEHSITFHYTDGRWVRTQLYSTEWPDLSKILDATAAPGVVPPALFEGLTTIRPFMDTSGRVYFRDGALHTSTENELGASYEIEELHGEGVYNLDMLSLLDGVAERIDFTAYPDPLLFYGDRLRGAIIGQRL